MTRPARSSASKITTLDVEGVTPVWSPDGSLIVADWYDPGDCYNCHLGGGSLDPTVTAGTGVAGGDHGVGLAVAAKFFAVAEDPR